jgi:hypothetical protein
MFKYLFPFYVACFTQVVQSVCNCNRTTHRFRWLPRQMTENGKYEWPTTVQSAWYSFLGSSLNFMWTVLEETHCALNQNVSLFRRSSAQKGPKLVRKSTSDVSLFRSSNTDQGPILIRASRRLNLSNSTHSIIMSSKLCHFHVMEHTKFHMIRLGRTKISISQVLWYLFNLVHSLQKTLYTLNFSFLLWST